MFYSEAILSKKGPLAKVWLAAHWERKLSKTQFLQTNIHTSVGAIMGDDQPPMALRLSGQLLLGVVRIYSRKARYLLEDCNEALVKIKMAFRKGVVDMPDEQIMASSNAITLADSITEFDIMLPGPDANVGLWDDPTSFLLPPSTPTSQQHSSSAATANISRPQDITLSDTVSRDTLFDPLMMLGGEDLLSQVPDTEDARDMHFDLGLEDDLGPITRGDRLLAPVDEDAMEDVEVEVGRDAAPEQSLLIDDLMGEKGKDREDVTFDEPSIFSAGDVSGLDALPVARADDDPLTALEGEAGEDVLEMDLDAPLQRIEEEGGEEGDDGEEEESGKADEGFAVFTPLQPEKDIGAGLGTPDKIMFELETPRPAVTPATTVATVAPHRRRKLIVDKVTELPHESIKSQIADTSDIVVAPTFLPPTRKLMLLRDIDRQGARYHLDLSAPAGLVPELRGLFERKIKRPIAAGSDGRAAKLAKLEKGQEEDEEEEKEEEEEDEARVPVGEDELEEPIGDSFAPEEPMYEGQGEDILERDITPTPPPKSKSKAKDQHVPDTTRPRSSDDASETGSLHNLFDAEERDEEEAQQAAEAAAMSKAKPGTAGAGSSSQGFSKSTVRTMKMLQREFGKREETGEDAVVRYEEMAGKAKRRDAVKLFFELLVLTTKDVVQVRQTESYGGIEVRPKEKLFEPIPIMTGR
ncbi:Rec8 like protein-domain-containing protein [Endogone sp. FLAS-F59071]|nr:Rec8 like protein-domain-containing protein [Endogone sp. FLAS-F59071]|eukprot:RUS14331.1 Rec8 like protein-domain-containing protein [Endogone sp. FLAS-F59071]